jgi:hypothetical protein
MVWSGHDKTCQVWSKHKCLPEEYDRSLGLIPDEVLQSTQPKEFPKLEKQYGADTSKKLSERIVREIGRYGVLDVLRKGVTDRGPSSSWPTSSHPAA